MFLADENIDHAIVSRLRDDGHDVVWVAELAPGLPDADVLAMATSQNRVVVTADKDFGELLFRRQMVGAVVLVRLLGMEPNRKASIVADAVRLHGQEMENAFTVISPTSVRIRAR
jgi:predicted nuclease of predicted toxin-antitoxin system